VQHTQLHCSSCHTYKISSSNPDTSYCCWNEQYIVAGAFFVIAEGREIFSRKSFFFLKNDFIENILRRKGFYVQINRV
jgi:hypothetical protein